MEGMLAAMIGFVGVLVSALLMWIHSDIKSIRAETNSRFDAMDRRFDTVNTVLAENGQRLARIETTLSVPVSPPEQASTEPAVAG